MNSTFLERSEVAAVVTHISGYGNAIVDGREKNQWLKSVIDHDYQGFSEQKDDYIVRWNGEKDYIINSKTPYKIDVIEDTEHYGLIVKINDQWFLPYHITPTINYDMI